jgi:hypothetical protein
VVLLYTSEETPTPPPAPLEVDFHEGYHRVFAPITTGEPLRVLRKRLRAYAEPLPNRVLLHPWDQNSVVEVAKNWREALQGEDLFRGPHAEFISFEIGDDWNTFLPFVDQERMLWESVHDLTGAEAATCRLDQLDEARTLGEYVANVSAERRSYGVGFQALSDIGWRLLVLGEARQLAGLAEANRCGLY